MFRLLSAAALLAVLAAGCGGSSRPERAAIPSVPRALARSWEGQASAIATAASAGNDCQALQLAVSLRAEVEKSEHEVPRRLRWPLLTGVKALAARATCPPPAITEPQKSPKPPPENHGDRERHHGHHGHGKGGGGDGADQ